MKQDKGKLYGFKVSRSSPSISHLIFVDDIFIFYNATLSKAHELDALLKQITELMGQEVNYKKSSCYFSMNSPLQAQKNDS